MSFTEEDIQHRALPAVVEHGKRLYTQGKVGQLQLVGGAYVAAVHDATVYRVVLEENSRRCACNCGTSNGRACEHVVAVMWAANGTSNVQTALDLANVDSAAAQRGGRDAANEMADEEEAAMQVRVVRGKPTTRLYLTERNGFLLVEVRFAYHDGAVEFRRADQGRKRLVPDRSGELVRVERSRAREDAAMGELGRYDLAPYQAGILTPSIEAREWVMDVLPELAGRGFEVYGREKLREARTRQGAPSMKVSVQSSENVFECQVAVSVDGIPASLAELINAVRNGERYVRLTDGSTGVLPAAWIEKLAGLLAVVDVDGDGDCFRGRSSQFGVLDTLREMADDWEGGMDMEQLQKTLRDFAGGESCPVPRGLQATLRPYQQAGYEWLRLLRKCGFGGCLADDMGLGKTIQTLSLLQGEKERGDQKAPSLIVVPSSLLFNWEREAARFTPQLRVLVYHGPARRRYQGILAMADILVTTYGTLLRDAEIFQAMPLHYVILDEAQMIKNPGSRVARVVRRLRSRFRVTLSGTPVENNLSELWSAMTFLNPGLLGSLNTFNQFYARPIEREDNEDRAAVLRRMIYPFVLRRTKAQVATELPPKIENVSYAGMLPRQESMYRITRELYQGKIARSIEENGVEGSRMQILEALLRLRQICCHPALVDPSFSGDSGKFRLVDQLLEEVIEGGHRALIFSQFVSALELLRKRLTARSIRTELLTGKTANRAAAVDNFQQDPSIPVFLISLKAGGVGLNLTAADYVIHLDPWWNPAIENQASDRAYRIGQTRQVFVYKLITRDSVEERVLEFQRRKQHLIGSVITTEQGLFKRMTPDDVTEMFS